MKTGDRLGPYEILVPLGAGGMGEVYRARDTRLDRDVAIKVLPEHLVGNREALARFEKEAKAVAALSHPNILALYDIGTEQGVHYAVTELLEGETLRSRLDDATLSWRKAAEIGAAIAEGLSAAHSKGIVHRDIKPGNLFLTSDGRVKILDFGLARYQPSTLSTEEAPTESLSGSFVGTVGYMSPEQIRGQPAGPASDIFSLGCVLYELATGRRAFQGPTANDTLDATLKEEPPPVTASGQAVPAELERIIGRCLHKSPGERIQSAHDLAFSLRDITGTAERPPPAPAGLTRRKWLVAGLAVAACVAGLWLYWDRGGETIDSLAVLPFVNTGGDPEAEYLSDGIAEALINDLSTLPRLKVIARTSAFRFKGRDADPQAAGRQLKVQAVLSGRVVQRGGSLSIQAELVDVRENRQLWGEQYTSKLTDLAALQANISREITAKLRSRLTKDEQKGLTRRQTGSAEAYQSYLKGTYFVNKRTPEGIRKSVEHFEQAIGADPAYALAHAALADSYVLTGSARMVASREANRMAEAAARRALQLDSTLSLPYVILGQIRMREFDRAGAEPKYRRAIELDPNNYAAYQRYALYLMSLGRFEEALEANRRARELDPLSLVTMVNTAEILYYARRYDQAIEELGKMLETDSNLALRRRGLVYAELGRFAEAIAALQKARSLGDTTSLSIADLGYVRARSGDHSAARKALADLGRLSRSQYVDSYDMAIVHAALGDGDAAFARLERAYDERAMGMRDLKVDPKLDSLRPDPRFAELLRRVGLGP